MAGSHVTGVVRQQIEAAIRPVRWGWAGGVFDELNRARAAALDALANEQDDDLRRHIEDALTWIDNQIDHLAAHQDELENG